MGYGGLVNTVVDPFGIGDSNTTPDVPNPNQVTNNYKYLLKGYLSQDPTVLATQGELLPQYTAMGMSNLASILGGSNNLTGDVTGVANALKTVNPGTGLSDTLRAQAGTGLAEGAQWNPEDMARTTNSVQQSWANRGLGTSMPAELDQTLQVLGGGEGLRQQRQGFAQSVAGSDTANASNLVNQATGIAGMGQGISTSAGPTLVPTNQTYDMFNTAYNARAASNIAGANNAAASENSY